MAFEFFYSFSKKRKRLSLISMEIPNTWATALANSLASSERKEPDRVRSLIESPNIPSKRQILQVFEPFPFLVGHHSPYAFFHRVALALILILRDCV